jgi:tricorn protease
MGCNLLSSRRLVLRLSPWSAVACLAVSFLASGFALEPAHAADKPHIFQHPALSKDLICFGYAGDLWTVPRNGGKAARLTTGVGIETAPVFSPDGSTIAFTGDYDGNTDVFTVPAAGGVPFRVTYHPAADFAVGWTPDGQNIVFRSTRDSKSRYTQLYTVPAKGGIATVMPLPMAYQGVFSPDGKQIAYSPLPPAFGFDYTTFVSWGNYRGGRASTIWITTLPGLESTEIPHEVSSDFNPVYAGGKIYFLSGRDKEGDGSPLERRPRHPLACGRRQLHRLRPARRVASV